MLGKETSEWKIGGEDSQEASIIIEFLIYFYVFKVYYSKSERNSIINNLGTAKKVEADEAKSARWLWGRTN